MQRIHIVDGPRSALYAAASLTVLQGSSLAGAHSDTVYWMGLVSTNTRPLSYQPAKKSACCGLVLGDPVLSFVMEESEKRVRARAREQKRGRETDKETRGERQRR